MKTHNLKSFLLMLAMMCISVGASAYDFEVGGIYYGITSSTDKTCCVTYKDNNYNTYSGTVTIPSSVNYNSVEYNVTSIGDCAFKFCTDLTSVTIPNSVMSIGNEAFLNCSSLPITDNIRYADSYLIEVVDRTLSSYNIKEGTRFIRPAAFSSCSNLTSITIPNSVTSIGQQTFENCSNLKSITLPNSLTSIGKLTFNYCSSLTSITIPNSVTSIEYCAFSGCSGLTSVTIPNSVTRIEDCAFSGCSGLTSMTIPNSVTSLGSAFPGCEALTSVTVDTGNPNYSSEDNVIYTKDKSSLVYCMTSKKGQFVIPNSVTSIGSYAFSGSRITTVIIPNSVTSIGSWAFNGCSGLTSINIPNSVTRIKDGAFAGCSGLASITIPNSVTSIEGYTFSSCSNLTSITIPNSVTSIGNSAFSACISLTSYTIPNSVTSIGNWAFSFCVSLTDITIPNSVTTIRDWAFGYCYSLKNVTCYATESPETNSNAFDSAPISSATLYVPEASIEKYRNIGPWSEFETILAVEDYHTDLSKYDNIVYIDDVTARTGGEVALSVKLKNKDAVYGYEFKLELPAGATVVTTTDKFGDTEIQASMTEVRTNSKRHTFSTSLKNGILTVLCYSTEKKAFTDNDGEVAQIKITLASGIEPGTYPIKITNEAISLESSTPVIPLVGQSLTVTPRIVGDVNGDGKVDILDLAALISHLNGSTPPNFNEGAADVDNSGSLSEADITPLSKLILGK